MHIYCHSTTSLLHFFPIASTHLSTVSAAAGTFTLVLFLQHKHRLHLCWWENTRSEAFTRCQRETQRCTEKLSCSCDSGGFAVCRQMQKEYRQTLRVAHVLWIVQTKSSSWWSASKTQNQVMTSVLCDVLIWCLIEPSWRPCSRGLVSVVRRWSCKPRQNYDSAYLICRRWWQAWMNQLRQQQWWRM